MQKKDSGESEERVSCKSERERREREMERERFER
jgi:hypothetical protein